MIRDFTFSKLVMNKTIQTRTLTKQKKRHYKTISRSLRTIANTSCIVFAKITFISQYCAAFVFTALGGGVTVPIAEFHLEQGSKRDLRCGNRFNACLRVT